MRIKFYGLSVRVDGTPKALGIEALEELPTEKVLVVGLGDRRTVRTVDLLSRCEFKLQR
jgi:tRNA A37 threonylcarbamoyladenosine dehydratase